MATVVDFLDDGGGTALPPGFSLTIDGATGAVGERVQGVATSFRGFLANDKRLMAGVSTPAPRSSSLAVARKRGGATYSNADVRGRPFALHSLRDGPEGWRYGTGTIDADGVVSVSQVVGPALTPLAIAPPPDGATLSVDQEGFVTDGGQFSGFLTSDKTAIFAVHTDATSGTVRAITAIVFTDEAHALPHLAGTFGFASLVGNATPMWISGLLEFDSAGRGTYRSIRNSAGDTTLPPPLVVSVAPDGLMTAAENPWYRGTLAAGAGMYVRTQTHGSPPPGRYGFAVVLRR